MKMRKGEPKKDTDEHDLARREDVYWRMDPFRNFDRFFEEFFRDFRDEFGSRFWGPHMWSRSGGLAKRTPSMDLKDTGKEYVLTADMPGVSKEDIDITVHEDSVEIEAKKEVDKEEGEEGYYYRERSGASYYRRIPLPEDVDAENAQGKLTDGVLELTLPKLKPTETKTHKVKLD